MPLSRYVDYTTTGTKEGINLDPSIAPFDATAFVNVGTTATYKLQYTLAAPDVADASALWADSLNIPTGTTATSVTNIVAPVSRVRLVIAALTGTLSLHVLQGYTNN